MHKNIRENVKLSRYSSFRVGGPAKYLSAVKSEDQLEDALNFASRLKERVLVLGKGSNTLISDNGFDGIVIANNLKGIEVDGEKMVAASGEILQHVVQISVNERLYGLHKLGWIPGTIGGAVAGNAGAYGVQIGDFVEEVEVFDIIKNKRIRYSQNQCKFEYRSSIFKGDKSIVILNITLRLCPKTDEEILEEYEQIEESRARTLPVKPSCGCNFKNFMSNEVGSEIVEKLKKLNADTEKVIEKSKGKLPAGFIIESLGLKGKMIGGAKVSDDHANIIVNTGKATASNIYDLINLIKDEVKTKLGIDLQLEIEIIGDF